MDLEAQVAALRERHNAGKISAEDLELMIEGACSKWARDHPPPRAEAKIESASPLAEGNNVNLDGNEGARVTHAKLRGAVRVNITSVGGMQSIELQLEIAQLKKFVDGTVEVPEHSFAELVVQVALKPCRLRVDAGFQSWQFIIKTYKATDDLYIGQLEQRLTYMEMGEHESAIAYSNRAQQILTDLRMAGVDYSMSSYVTHAIKGLPTSYNLLRHMVKLLGVREELDENTLSSYIIEEEFTLESERRKEQLLPQVNYVASKQQRQQQKWAKSRGGSDNDKQVNRAKTTKSGERSGGGKRNSQCYCFVCGDPDHFPNQCFDRVNKDAGDGQEASCGRSQNRQPRRETAYRKDNQHSDSKSKQPLDAGTSCGNGAKEAPSDNAHHEGQPSCLMVGVVTDASAEPTISLATEVGEDFQVVAAPVQANPTMVLLDSGCFHHLMGTREAFVDMTSGGDVHHANLLSAGQLKDSGVQFQDTSDKTLLVSTEGVVLGRACYTSRVLYTDLRPCSSQQPKAPPTETVALRTIASSTRSSVDIWHARLTHAGIDTIMRIAAHGVAAGLEITSSSGADLVYMARQQIHRHKQFGSVTQYTQQMEGLFNRITDLTEGEKIQAYDEGLKMEVRRQVIAANYNNYRDMVCAAERFDALTRDQPETRRHVPNRSFGTKRSAPPTTADPMDINKIDAKQRPTKYENCEFCGAAGHRFLACWKMKKARAELQGNNSATFTMAKKGDHDGANLKPTTTTRGDLQRATPPGTGGQRCVSLGVGPRDIGENWRIFGGDQVHGNDGGRYETSHPRRSITAAAHRGAKVEADVADHEHQGFRLHLGARFLEAVQPEIDCVNKKVCIYNNGKRVELRSWTDTGSVRETTLARLERTVNESNTVYLALVMAAGEEEKPSSELPSAVKEILEQYKDIIVGHMVSADGVHVDPRKIEAVKKWKVLENVKELQQFLGFANYYNRFVPQYAKIAAPLTDLLKKDTPFKWDTPHQQAMEQLQTALTTAPVLILPDPDTDYVVETDASDQAVGAVLMQDHGRDLQPIAYLSKKPHGAELNYPIHDKEALAIVIAFKAWRCYLEGAKTTVYTDRCSLKYLKSQRTLKR
ncbi:unnamed protein product [Closterium sp. NIES-53]